MGKPVDLARSLGGRLSHTVRAAIRLRAAGDQRRWLKRSVIAAGLVIAAYLLLPRPVQIEHARTIDLPRDTLFAQLNDYRQIARWWTSRFADDPNASIEHGDVARGVGSKMAWKSRVLGDGRETIVASAAPDQIEAQVEIGGRTAGMLRYRFDARENAGTRVTVEFVEKATWNPLRRIASIGLRERMEQVLSQGLDDLARNAERLPPFDFAGLEVEHVEVVSADVAWVPSTSEPFAPAIADAMNDAYMQITGFIDENQLSEAGPPVSVSRDFDGEALRFDAGVPVKGVRQSTPLTKDAVRLEKSYGGPAIKVTHRGPLLRLSETHDRIAAYLAAHGLERNGDAWEAYVSDPTQTADEELVTYVYYPVRDAGRD